MICHAPISACPLSGSIASLTRGGYGAADGPGPKLGAARYRRINKERRSQAFPCSSATVSSHDVSARILNHVGSGHCRCDDEIQTSFAARHVHFGSLADSLRLPSECPLLGVKQTQGYPFAVRNNCSNNPLFQTAAYDSLCGIDQPESQSAVCGNFLFGFLAFRRFLQAPPGKYFGGSATLILLFSGQMTQGGWAL